MTLPSINEVEQITLPDGSTLDARQSLTVFLHVTEPKMTWTEIAKRAGYSSPTVPCDFIRRRRGQEAVRLAITQHMTAVGLVGLHSMLALAKSAKSENVRQLAAADLMDRAGIAKRPWQPEQQGAGGGLQININLSGDEAGRVLIDGKAMEAD